MAAADVLPESKRVVVKDAAGKDVVNVSIVSISAEKGDVVFQPNSGAGTYYVY